MATRKTRETHTLGDTSAGTVNIVHGRSSPPQNTGFFSSGFTNTRSSKGKKRRRRLHAQAQHQAAQARVAEEARIQAEAQARVQIEHEARIRAEAEAAEQARIDAETHARVQREHAYRTVIETLVTAQHAIQSSLAQQYSQGLAALESTLLAEIGSISQHQPPDATGHELVDLIFQEKVRINQLLAQKQAELETAQARKNASIESLDASTQESYRHYLESQSQGDTARAHQAHKAWIDASAQASDVQRLVESITYLQERSTALSQRHAQASLTHSQPSERSPETARHTVQTERLWSAISGPASPSTQPTQSDVQEKATQIAKRLFAKQAINLFRRNPKLALLFYSPTLGDAERPASILATPVSELDLPSSLDLGYVAGVNGTVDVPHRLFIEEADSQPVPKWVAADGVDVGTKVRVRTFTYNVQNNTYTFIRDGDTTPALVWTPITQPDDNSTRSPGQKPVLPADPGVDVSPQHGSFEGLPGFFSDDPDDYILVFPAGSGLPDTYVLFKDPRTIPGIATGYGKPVTGIWLGESPRAQGASIPSHIADQLRGRRFSHFNKLRDALWEAINKDALRSQFNNRNKQELDEGNAPFARVEDHVGGRMKFEIHHKNEVAKGGAVYDIDNLVIMTPRQHIDHHNKRKNKNED